MPQFSSPAAAALARGEWPTHFARYLNLMMYGQSNSNGSAGQPSLTTTQPYSNVMLNTGILEPSWRSAGTPASFSALIEADYDSTWGETGVAAAANMLVEKLASWAAHPNQGFSILGSSAGRGGQTISQLSQGGSNYTAMLGMLESGRDIAYGADETIAYLATLWTQGENDQQDDLPRATYLTRLRTLIADIEDDVIAATGQTWIPPFLIVPPGSHIRYYNQSGSSPRPEIALAQRDAWTGARNIFGVCPSYVFDFADHIHTDNEGHRMRGKYYGRALARIMLARLTGATPGPLCVDLKDAIWQGDAVDLQMYVPHPPLELDTSWVASETNSGFDLWQSDGLTLKNTISSVAVQGPDRVRIKFSATPASGDRLTYGFGRPATTTNTSGRTAGPRGNLRDNEGDTDSYVDGDTVTRYLHNYCQIFETVKP